MYYILRYAGNSEEKLNRTKIYYYLLDPNSLIVPANSLYNMHVTEAQTLRLITYSILSLLSTVSSADRLVSHNSNYSTCMPHSSK
jgi:hypothetical protein